MKATLLRLLGRPQDEHFENVLDSVAGGRTRGGLPVELLRARGLGAVVEGDGDFVVAGVVDRDGSVAGLEVIVTREQLGKKPSQLAETKTNDDGEFSVRFKADDDDIVRVFVNHGRDRLLTPPRRIEHEMWVEWGRPGKPVRRPGTFELRDALLRKVVGDAGLRLEDLEESLQRLQVSLVAETAGISRGQVALHALSARLERKLRVPRAVLFALLGRALDEREGTPPPAATAVVVPLGDELQAVLDAIQRDALAGTLPERVERLAEQVMLATDVEALRAAVSQAVNAGVVSGRVEDGIEQVAAVLEKARVAMALRSPTGPRRSWMARLANDDDKGRSWGSLLDVAGVPRGRLEDAGRLLLEHADGPNLRRALAALAPEANRAKVGDALALAALVDDDPVALTALHDQKVTRAASLAALPEDKLVKIASKAFAHGVNPRAKAQQLVDALDRAHPSASLARYRAGKLTRHTQDVLRRDRLLSFNVEDAFRKKALGDARERDRTRHELLGLQRVARLTKHARLAHLLLENGFDSSAGIAFTDRRTFVARMRGAAAPSELERVHRRARSHYRATLALYLRHNRQANGPALRMMSIASDVDYASIAGAPSWEFLLGSPDYCDCEHCASVTSPAAYLVDLLLWLQRAPGVPLAVYRVLVDKRPDLVKILLNCANTNTEVPYIDLVCELLEEEVALRMPGTPLTNARPQVEASAAPYRLAAGQDLQLRFGAGGVQVVAFQAADFIDMAHATAAEVVAAINAAVAGGRAVVVGAGLVIESTGGLGDSVEVVGGAAIAGLGLSVGVSTRNALDERRHRRQTRLTAAEIRAYPEYIDSWVYNGVLAGFTDRMVSPFDLSTAEIRAHLALKQRPRLGITRLELLELFENGTPADRAAEHFGLASAEWNLITTAVPTQAAALTQWGFAGPTVPLETWLRRARSPKADGDHLDYDGLRALLACEFPNPGGVVRERLEVPVTVDLCRATDRELVNLSFDVLDRQHRFLRLARRVSWSFAELDLLLRSLGGNLDAATATALAALERVGRRTGLGGEELASMFADFDAAQVNGKFADGPTLYARTFLVRADGAPPPVFLDPATTVLSLAAAAPLLQGALSVTDAELAAIVAATGLAGNVTFASLSTLNRHARLAQALRLDVEVFEILRTAIDPFANAASLLRFVDAADEVRGLDPADLSVLVGGAGVAGDVAALEAALTTLKQETRDRLTAALGAPPTPLQVVQEIDATKSWVGVAAAWLELDTRFADVVAATDAGGMAAALCPVPAGPPTAAALQPLLRAAALVRVLGADPERAALTAALPGVVTTLRAPSVAAVRSAMWFHRAVNATNADADAWSAFFAGAAAAPRDVLAGQLADAGGVDVAVVRAFWDIVFGAGGLDRVAVITPAHQSRLRRCAGLCGMLGVGPDLLSSWALPWPTAVEAASLRNAIRSRVSREDWLLTSTEVQDQLRERRRDALVSYLIATAGAGQPSTTADLYGRFLIDVAMDDCMTTSRIVQANAAIQLFVQRCFAGLEGIAPGALDDDHWKQWQWRERYRLWEANRMVFLYPENFLNVARRSNASPQFRDFMKEVRQSERDDEAVRTALDSYLAGLEQIANLDHAAVATNLSEAGAIKSLHLVSRSRTTPQKHYHRSLSGNVWTPWEIIDVGSPGRHLALSHTSVCTTLVWPTFADHPDPRQAVPGLPAPPGSNQPDEDAPPPRGVTYLSYGWIKRDRKKWSDIETSARALLHQKRARSGMVTVPASGGTSTLLTVYSPSSPQNASQQLADVDRPMLGWLQLERDITAIVVNATRRGLSSWLGGDHQPHIDTTGTLQGCSCTLGSCTCTFIVDTYLTPWPGLSFTENRMTAQLKTTTLAVPVETVAGRTTKSVLKASFFSVAPDMSKLLDLPPVPGRAGGFENIVIGGARHDFGSDAFAVTDETRSFLALSSQATLQLAPQTPIPDLAVLLLVPAYHPFAAELRNTVRSTDDGLERIFVAAVQEDPGVALRRAAVDFDTLGDFPLIGFSAPSEAIEFGGISPYALYNWEVFFHVPLFVAEQLRAARRFEEARRFYHFIFNPFPSEPVDLARPRARYWVTKPLREDQGINADIRTILQDGAVSGINPFTDIENHPFDAQRVAQARPSAYQKHVVMRYLDNLIGWGDSLFRSGEREQVMESIQLYLLAQTILGPRPERLKPLGTRVDLAFEDREWGGGANALVEIENLIAEAGEDPAELGDTPIVELPLGLYFCVPPNKALLRYWDDVDRRLYNLRHCLSLDGQPVRYDLLSAPIDPQALVDAAAAGVSVADALAMAAAPLPPHRFRTMWARALEACNDVKSLGSALLQALEKRDAEAAARVRSTWEGKILERTGQLRAKQREQSQAELDALIGSKTLIDERLAYLQSREYMNDLEKAAVGLAASAGVLDTTGFVFDILGGVLYLIPNVDLGISGFGGTPQAGASTGGESIGNSTTRTSQGLSRLAGLADRAGGMVATQAGYVRRKEEWDHLASQAQLEIAQLTRQTAAARLRVAVADAEIAGHESQRASWEETDAILREKFSNEERFGWMIESLADLYREAFQHAVRLTKTARECLRYELPARVVIDEVGDGLWESLHHGLLAGDRLSAELRELDATYARERPWEREVLQHVPLSHVDPRALVQLRRSGGCEFRIPRWWWQRFDPGLAGRKVRRISVSVPSVTGPYTGMNATLQCLGVHKVPSSISLSRGSNDFGVDIAVAGERYLPFEGIDLEAETRWSFAFPADPNGAAGVLSTDVDFTTINDVILHVEYVADVGPPALDAPPVLEAYVDLRAMDADGWAQLVMTPAHTCRVVVAGLVPRFLAGRAATAIVSKVALLDDGSDVAADLVFALGAGVDAGTLTIQPGAAAAFDWKTLSRVFIGLRM